ncbi:sporulation protein YqfD [Pontibacillus yanchengensis]|uniref:Sporulation protein YqfD n=2 Tax=Pontibacillus yanchengensis TaxID=462910 RepID=A0ACC7VFM5_9BACI|nr:sporulation protein YqfD [Pontibacillus yanchengensis]MYL33430.1 sporulation protein YqfD [Pontibacillus yanchengensis]MYL53480.1 sporulation protein YqfD [Pontibacillus yanchengensis]
MKRTQGVFFNGYTTFKVKGNFPEFFLNRCVENGIVIWNVKKIDESSCQANIKLEDIPKLKDLRKNMSYKITFSSRIGLPFLVNAIWKRKPLVIGFLLSLILIFTLSNMVWDIDIEGVTPEIEHKIKENLDEYGVRKGAWKLNLETPSEMQQKLLNDVPELLWIGITEKGTTYHLQGVEKTVVEEKEKGGPQHLIARKKGIIVDMYVEKGEPQVNVNDFVQPGDILVSGLIGGEEDQQVVHAEGEVIAETWYESEVSIPINVEYKVITGEKEKQYAITLFKTSIPLWGFTKPDFKQVFVDEKERPLYLYKWKLPIAFKTKQIWEQEVYVQNRTQDDAVLAGIEQAKKELSKQLPIDAKILSEKILHQKKENGKVNLILYIKVQENIVKPYPITQGD